MSVPTWRFAVWRVMGHSGRFAPRALPCARRTRCTSSSACTKSSGTGTDRQWSLRRFSVAIRSSPASRSTSHARIPSASETRHPVIARVRARVWTAGFGCERAAARMRSRSLTVRYFRPRASTRENVPSVMDRKSYLTSRVMTRPPVALPSPRPSRGRFRRRRGLGPSGNATECAFCNACRLRALVLGESRCDGVGILSRETHAGNRLLRINHGHVGSLRHPFGVGEMRLRPYYVARTKARTARAC